jgi:hypothetical protein
VHCKGLRYRSPGTAHRRLGTERPSPSPSPARTPSGSQSKNATRYTPSTSVVYESGGQAAERQPLLGTRPPLRSAANSPRSPQQVTAVLQPRRASSLAGSRPGRLVPKAHLIAARSSAAGTPSEDQSVQETTGILTLPISQPPPSEPGELGPHEEPVSPGSKESDYLRSKLWWLGFALMNVGEFGNFLSYAYAPASVVAPLGAVSLKACDL